MARLFRRLQDMEKRMQLTDRLMWLSIAVAVAYCGWAIVIMYVNIKMGAM